MIAQAGITKSGAAWLPFDADAPLDRVKTWLRSANSQLPMEPTLTPERRASVFAINARAVHRMNRLLGDLLDVVRLEARKLALEIRPCDIDGVLAEAAEAFQTRAAEHGVNLQLAPDSPGVVIAADGERVLQRLDNLVGNALKFTPAGGTVTISSRVGDGRVQVAVADSGPGYSGGASRATIRSLLAGAGYRSSRAGISPGDRARNCRSARRGTGGRVHRGQRQHVSVHLAATPIRDRAGTVIVRHVHWNHADPLRGQATSDFGSASRLVIAR